METELSTSTIMLIFFIIFMIISLWKIWAFLPNKRLADDDTTEESSHKLELLMLKIIEEKKGLVDEKELFTLMSEDKDFDAKLFWRFNLNRLKQLLNVYYIKHEGVSTIENIYNLQKEKK